jgi:hypothetical protein
VNEQLLLIACGFLAVAIVVVTVAIAILANGPKD